LSFQSVVNVSFVLLIVSDEEALTEIGLLSVTAKRIKLVGADSEIIDDSVIVELELVIIFFEFIDKTIDKHGQML